MGFLFNRKNKDDGKNKDNNWPNCRWYIGCKRPAAGFVHAKGDFYGALVCEFHASELPSGSFTRVKREWLDSKPDVDQGKSSDSIGTT